MCSSSTRPRSSPEGEDAGLRLAGGHGEEGHAGQGGERGHRRGGQSVRRVCHTAVVHVSYVGGIRVTQGLRHGSVMFREEDDDDDDSDVLHGLIT